MTQSQSLSRPDRQSPTARVRARTDHGKRHGVDHSATITTGLVSATTTPMLLKLVAQGKLAPERFASHRLTFDSIIDAYDTIGGAAETKALKVVITG